MNFEYFYGNEAEQYVFFRIPKALITDDYFKNLSSDAKILYGLMLDRLGLSIKNKWLDKQDRVYIIYQNKEIQNDLNCADKKATKLINELYKIGLIDKKRIGLNKPNIYYVKNFSTSLKYRNRVSDESGIVKTTNPDSSEARFINNNYNKTDFNETYINNNNPVESTEQENADAVVVVQQIKDLISSQLHKDLTDTQITKIIQTKGFDYERLEKIVQIAKGQNIKSLVGWLIAAIKNPDFDLKPKSVDGSVNALDSTKNHKNKICNYKGADWDFDKLKKLENQLIDEQMKKGTHDMRE